ncbi:hypothetical protein [Ralstonia phage RSF1]|uniref:Uncharacterized protein n=1 Tax=Ralstonia phage RSF1 TaxID=1689679 RepID=A0A0K2QQT6_9CAUD|nr:hypothetical protein AVU11_agp33 [Ralstonia phage RSF1]BAS04954.2 hypothetical protein [Ralstonia phage RSF1]
MGSLETLPPVLEAVKADPDGTIAHRRLGFDAPIYPTQVQPGWLLEVEQLVIARHDMTKLLLDNLNMEKVQNQDPEFVKALNETTKNVMVKLSMISYFNANAMFTGSHIPQRMAYEGLQVLDYLVSMVILQRKRVAFTTEVKSDVAYPSNMFNKLELDRVIGSIHQAEMHGLWQDPEKLVKFYGMLDETFYRQCAMAYSMATGVAIPEAYVDNQLGKVFFWALQVMNASKDDIPNLMVRPKPQNVVSLFKTK